MISSTVDTLSSDIINVDSNTFLCIYNQIQTIDSNNSAPPNCLPEIDRKFSKHLLLDKLT